MLNHKESPNSLSRSFKESKESLIRKVQYNQFTSKENDLYETIRKSISGIPEDIITSLKEYCKLCKNVKGTMNLPKCSNHKYCLTCMQSISSKELNIECDSCRIFFNALLKPKESQKFRCTTCEYSMDLKNICKLHSYCSKCIEFYKSADINSLALINHCKKCLKHFKKFIDSRAQIPESVLNIISTKSTLKNESDTEGEGDKSIKLLKSNHFSNKSSQNLIKNQDELKTSRKKHKTASKVTFYLGQDQKNLEINSIIPPVQTISISEEKSNLSDPKLIQIIKQDNKKRLNLPKTEINPQRIKNIELHKSKSEKTKTLNKSFISSNLESPKNKNLTNQSKSFRSISPLIVRPQKNFNLPEEKNEEFVQNMIALKKNSTNFIDLDNTKLGVSNYESVCTSLTFCTCCNSSERVKGFLCNHNLCLECIVFTGIAQIDDFFELYKGEKSVINYQFFFICPVKECPQIINIPCNLIMRELEKYIERKVKRFEKYFVDYDPKLQFWNEWASYFDGLGFK